MNELVSLAAKINREHNLAEQMAKAAIKHALKAGELLIQAKAQCGHGEWLSWVDNNLEIGPRQAQRYMRLANHRELLANASAPSHLSLDTALAVIAAPKETETDKQPHEMLAQAADVIGRLTPGRLTQPDIVDSVLQEIDPPFPVRLKIMADGAMERDGVIWRTHTRQRGMLEAACDFGAYYAGLTVRGIADDQGISVDKAIAGICKYAECTPGFLHKSLAFLDQADAPPILPDPDDLRGYVRQQVAIELAA